MSVLRVWQKLKRGGEMSRTSRPPVVISLQTESLLSFLFGKKSTHGLQGKMRARKWRQYSQKAITHFRKYVEANLVSDGEHERQIDVVLSELEKLTARTTSDPELFSWFLRLCFLLLSEYPDHWRQRRVLDRTSSYLLGRFRTCQYCQSVRQRALLIYECASSKEAQAVKNRYPACAVQGDYAGFIKLFRERCPGEYSKMLNRR